MKLSKLIQETKAVCRFYQFLRCECGLREVDKLTAKELRVLLEVILIGSEDKKKVNFSGKW